MPLAESDRWRALLVARRAAGPSCEWCTATANEYEAEYCIDHNAGSDYLRFAEDAHTACRAGNHMSEIQHRRMFRRPGDALR